MTNLRLTVLLAGLSAALGATLAVSDTRPNTSLASYVLFATQDIRSRGFQVDCGNIGTEGDLILRRPLLAPSSTLAAGRVFTLGQGATCNVQQLFLHPDAPPGQPCGIPATFTGPILQPQDAAQQCDFPTTFACASSDPGADRLVGPGETVTLEPGAYRDIRIRGAAGRAGSLVLSGGTYDFCSLRVYRRAQVLFAGPATVRIAGDGFRIGDLSFTGPLPNSNVDASQIRIYSTSDRVSFRRRAEVHALVCAPNARLLLDNRVVLEGRAVARSIRTDRFVVVRTPGCIVSTTSTTLSTSSTTSTTRPVGSTTTTTSTTSTTHPGCGNGTLDPGEECDDNLCRGSCGSPGGAFVSDCSAALLRCIDCHIDRSDCPSNPSTTTTLRTTTTRRATTTTTTSTTTTLPPAETPAEICGDCIDNDHNGLTDFEDPACCGTAQTFTMSLTRARLIPRGTTSKVALSSTLARAGLTRFVDPTHQDVMLQLRPATGADVLCVQLPRASFVQKKRTFRFKDKTGTVAGARGLRKVVVAVKNDGSVRFKARGKQVALTGLKSGALQLTVGFRSTDGSASGNRCSKTTAPFRTGRKGSLRAP